MTIRLFITKSRIVYNLSAGLRSNHFPILIEIRTVIYKVYGRNIVRIEIGECHLHLFALLTIAIEFLVVRRGSIAFEYDIPDSKGDGARHNFYSCGIGIPFLMSQSQRISPAAAETAAVKLHIESMTFGHRYFWHFDLYVDIDRNLPAFYGVGFFD